MIVEHIKTRNKFKPNCKRFHFHFHYYEFERQLNAKRIHVMRTNRKALWIMDLTTKIIFHLELPSLMCIVVPIHIEDWSLVIFSFVNAFFLLFKIKKKRWCTCYVKDEPLLVLKVLYSNFPDLFNTEHKKRDTMSNLHAIGMH